MKDPSKAVLGDGVAQAMREATAAKKADMGPQAGPKGFR
jgi:hypothetical protein